MRATGIQNVTQETDHILKNTLKIHKLISARLEECQKDPLGTPLAVNPSNCSKYNLMDAYNSIKKH